MRTTAGSHPERELGEAVAQRGAVLGRGQSSAPFAG
jgi:hypothetical protein